jgi:hypothetical protein
MEIELLQKKLNYYKSQFELFDNKDNYQWKNMIEGINRQLSEKINELNQKSAKRHLNEMGNYRHIRYESAPLNRFSMLERRKTQIGQQISNLHMLSDKGDSSMEITDESRNSMSTVKTNISIPNEYESKVANIKKLKNMVQDHKMINRPLVDFGQSPEKNEQVLRESIRTSNNRSITPNFKYIRVKNKYKEMRESRQFSPKN